MLSGEAQPLKVEQTGKVIEAGDRFQRNHDETQSRQSDSPNKGHAATGRTREHLTPAEMDRLLAAAKKTARNSHRNFMIVLMTYRHGLRVSEATDLRWSDIDFERSEIYVRRKKGSKSTVHPLQGDEMRGLRRLQRESPESAYVFVNSKGTPLATSAIASMVKRLGKGVIEFPIHVHMLRHACGYFLANRGIDTRTIQDYMGHRNIQNTQVYTALAPGKFKGLWD